MRELLLSIIAANDGKLTWKTLDRLLVGKADLKQMLPTLKALINDGMIVGSGSTNMPVYAITAKGIEALHHKKAA